MICNICDLNTSTVEKESITQEDMCVVCRTLFKGWFEDYGRESLINRFIFSQQGEQDG